MKSMAYSLSLGLTVGAVLAVLSRRELIPLEWYFSLLIGLGSAVLLGTVLAIILRPSDRRIARMIDREFSLGERAETMTVLRGESGDMIELQREDANRRLAELPVRSFRIKRIGAAVAVLLVSLGLVAGSFAVPAVADTPPEEIIVDEYEKDWRIAALKALIERVKSDAYAEEGLKADLVTELESLIAAVRATEKQAVMTTAAVNTVESVREVEDGYDSYDEIASPLAASSLSLLQGLAKAIVNLDDTAFEDGVEKVIDSFAEDTLSSDISDFNDKLLAALRAVELTRADDALYAALNTFANRLATVADTLPTDFATQLEDAAWALTDAGYTALLQQSDNVRLTNIVVSEIISVFALTDADFEAEGVIPPSDSEAPDTEQEKEDDDEDSNNAGGMGTGETLVGSNDYVYDPDLDAYVKYAEVLNKYYAIFDSSVTDYPEELGDGAKDYFSTLFTPEDLQ